jgi:hypothetical protein
MTIIQKPRLRKNDDAIGVPRHGKSPLAHALLFGVACGSGKGRMAHGCSPRGGGTKQGRARMVGRPAREATMKRQVALLVTGLLGLDALLAPLARAAGGKASDLVVVADTRVLNNEILLYFANLYNTNIVLFAVWTVVLTAAYGCFLGVTMDKLMSLTGLDLRSRKIVEH